MGHCETLQEYDKIIGVAPGNDVTAYYTLLTVITVLIAYLSVFWWCRREKKNQFIDSLAGPKQFPLSIVGNALQLLPRQKTLKTMEEWALKYGRCFRLAFGGEQFVWLNSPSVIQALLRSSDVGHNVKPDCLYGHLKPFHKTNVFLANGYEWKSKRKNLMLTMTFNALKSYMPLLNRHSQRLVEDLEQLFRDGQSHSIHESLCAALFETISEMVTGVDLHDSSEGAKFRYAMKLGEDVLMKRVLEPWLQIEFLWNLHPLAKETAEASQTLNRFIQELINQHRSNHVSKDVKNDTSTPTVDDDLEFCSVLERLYKAGLSDEEIAQETSIMLAAGNETSSSSLHSFCFFMALNPEHQEKCRKEVDKFVEIGKDITMDDLANLKYLEWSIMEAMRIYPAGFIFARELESPLQIDEKTEMPIGTRIILSPWTMHRNPDYFPNPEKFDPMRFSPEETAKRPYYAYLPFSAGPRNCLGFKFAMMELKMCAAQIIRHFVLETTDRFEDICMVPCVVLEPERHANFILRKRT